MHKMMVSTWRGLGKAKAELCGGSPLKGHARPQPHEVTHSEATPGHSSMRSPNQRPCQTTQLHEAPRTFYCRDSDPLHTGTLGVISYISTYSAQMKCLYSELTLSLFSQKGCPELSQHPAPQNLTFGEEDLSRGHRVEMRSVTWA